MSYQTNMEFFLQIPALFCAVATACISVVTVSATMVGKVGNVRSERTNVRSPHVMGMADVLKENVSAMLVSRAQTVE